MMNLANIRKGCNINKFHRHNPFVIENMNLYFKNNNFNLQAIQHISDRKYLYLCSCGKEFITNWSEILNRNKWGCNTCTNKQSQYEREVEQYLLKCRVKYKKEYRFKDCIDKKPLPFDFYLPNYRTCIEVDGSQHFYENKMFKNVSLEERKYKDNIKTEYCKNNGIQLLRIPFWFIHNKKYRNIINKILM